MCLALGLFLLAACARAEDDAFYVPENPRFTIVDSAIASLEFTVHKTLGETEKGNLACISSFVDPEGQVMHWHDFGDLEGPGWAANAVGGAQELFSMGEFLDREPWRQAGIRLLDHVLEEGFIDEETGLIRAYRDTQTGEFCLNYKHNSQWFCPGSMAKIGIQLLEFADRLERADPPSRDRVPRMREAAARCGAWLAQNLEAPPNGWFPRRCTPGGQIYRQTPEGGSDAFWQTSADGLYIVWLQIELTEHGLADYRSRIADQLKVFTGAGGIFGSINHDTYDAHENVAYSVAFRTLLRASRLLDDPALRQFAYATCLDGLERFKMREDRNGVDTAGLLYMERTWNTAYLWENAEAALAYFEAAEDVVDEHPDRARGYLMDGLTILRAAARHHYGEHGFLTEGVDWDNVVGQQHHVDGARYGAIKYTEPLLNNQHIVEPTLVYLRKFAEPTESGVMRVWRDLEGNAIHAGRRGR